MKTYLMSAIFFSAFSIQTLGAMEEEIIIKNLLEYQKRHRRAPHTLSSHIENLKLNEEQIEKIVDKIMTKQPKPKRYGARIILHFATQENKESKIFLLIEKATQLKNFSKTITTNQRRVAQTFYFPPRLSQEETVNSFCPTEDLIANGININSAKLFAEGLIKRQHFTQKHLILALWKKRERFAILLLSSGVDVFTPFYGNSHLYTLNEFAQEHNQRLALSLITEIKNRYPRKNYDWRVEAHNLLLTVFEDDEE